MTENIRPNQKRAQLAEKLIIAVMIMDVVGFVASYLQLDLLHLIDSGAYVSDEKIDQNDSTMIIVAIVYMAVYTACIVFFLQWFRRAYYNLHQRVKCDYTDGWAVGFWFIPILSLFRPYNIMKEMWFKTGRIIGQRLNTLERPSESPVGWWWTVWIISSIVGNLTLGSLFDDESIAGLIRSTIRDLMVYALGIPLGILAIHMIRTYAAMEQKLNELESIETLGGDSSN